MTRKPANASGRRRRAKARGEGLAPRRNRRAERDYAQLHCASCLLRRWGAKDRAVRASLTLSAARDAVDWRRGEARLSGATLERIAVVFAIHRRLAATAGTLPSLRRAGRPPLSAAALLKGGRLSDLLGLWRQLVLAEEAAARRRARR